MLIQVVCSTARQTNPCVWSFFEEASDVEICGHVRGIRIYCEQWLAREVQTALRNCFQQNLRRKCICINRRDDETSGYYSWLWRIRCVWRRWDRSVLQKCLPDETLTLKSEKCFGGKRSKERVTLLFACNATGTEKLPTLMIGKSRKPRCFAGVKSFPFRYQANKKAWITTSIFHDWSRKIDRQMSRQNRQILLFVNNCSSHVILPPLTAVKVEFLPPNCTSHSL